MGQWVGPGLLQSRVGTLKSESRGPKAERRPKPGNPRMSGSDGLPLRTDGGGFGNSNFGLLSAFGLRVSGLDSTKPSLKHPWLNRERTNERLLDGFSFAISRYALLTKPSVGIWGAGASSRQQRPATVGGGTQLGQNKAFSAQPIDSRRRSRCRNPALANGQSWSPGWGANPRVLHRLQLGAGRAQWFRAAGALGRCGPGATRRLVCRARRQRHPDLCHILQWLCLVPGRKGPRPTGSPPRFHHRVGETGPRPRHESHGLLLRGRQYALGQGTS